MLTALASIKMVRADLELKRSELEKVSKRFNEVGPLGEKYNKLSHTFEMKVK